MSERPSAKPCPGSKPDAGPQHRKPNQLGKAGIDNVLVNQAALRAEPAPRVLAALRARFTGLVSFVFGLNQKPATP